MVVNICSEVLSRQVTETTPKGGVAEEGTEEEGAVEDGAVENGAGGEGAAEEAVNFEVPAGPSGSTLSFEWIENWTSSSHLGRVFSQYGNRNMEKDTNLWYLNNKADESVGLSAPNKEIKWKKGKGKKNKSKDKNKKNEKENVEELAEPVPEMRTVSGVGLV